MSRQSCPNCRDKTEGMGALGRAKAYRCRACGWTWTSAPPEPPRDPEKLLAGAKRLLAAWSDDHPLRSVVEGKVAGYEAELAGRKS